MVSQSCESQMTIRGFSPTGITSRPMACEWEPHSRAREAQLANVICIHDVQSALLCPSAVRQTRILTHAGAPALGWQACVRVNSQHHGPFVARDRLVGAALGDGHWRGALLPEMLRAKAGRGGYRTLRKSRVLAG